MNSKIPQVLHKYAPGPSKQLSISDIPKALEDLNIRLATKQRYQLYKELDPKRTGKAETKAFQQKIKEYMEKIDYQKEMQKVMGLVFTEGKISESELKNLFQGVLGVSLKEDEFKEMVKQLRGASNALGGDISVRDFVKTLERFGRV